MSCRERLEQFFRERGVKFQVVTHPEVYTAQEVAAVEHVSGYDVAKVVIASVDETLAMIVLPAPHRVDLDKVKRALGGAQARLAREEEFSAVFADCEVGAMPPFGSLYGLPVYVDRALTDDPRIVFRAGTHRETMTVAYADLERLEQPKVGDYATGPAAPSQN
ncbi:MAG: aminoacyl-tRNA deacylase [Candidatus Rokuibacteriota bacterium]